MSLCGEVERRVALVVCQVVVDEGDVLQHLQHLDHPVAAQVARGRLQKNRTEGGMLSEMWVVANCGQGMHQYTKCGSANQN